MFSAIDTGYLGECRDRRVGFVELAGFRERLHLMFVEPAVLVERLDERVSDGRFVRHGRWRRTCALCRLPYRVGHVARHWRVGGLEASPHRRRSLRDQFEVEMSRHGRTQADAGRKIVVALGAADQPGEAALGKLRAGIVDGALDHLVIAAQHQHVGHRAAQHPARRYRHQMRLALAARGFDQRFIVEPFRPDSTGAATSMRSSNASVRMVSGGAVSIGARRLASSALAELSM